MDKNKTNILVIPAHACPNINDVLIGREAIAIYNSVAQLGEFKQRGPMETDPSFRQVIPYVIMENVDTQHLVRMVRSTKQEEARLHNLVGIGVGGHIQYEDADENNPSLLGIVECAAYREIEEELGFTQGEGLQLAFAGVVISSKTEVDRVHVGMLFHGLTGETNFKGEKEMHNEEWATATGINKDYEDGAMEPWSHLVWERYYLVGTKR